jgi:hypothetical protein
VQHGVISGYIAASSIVKIPPRELPTKMAESILRAVNTAMTSLSSTARV